MDLIIDFYKELDTLNLIIFWGIIIVIILLLIFSFILINKNKKLKKIVETKFKNEEEIPIKKQELIEDSEDSIILEDKEQAKEEIIPIEIEKKFIVEEHISELQTDKKQSVEENKTTEEKKYHQINNIEIPNKPYQRNVLREMSLSQTSPIGITRPNIKDEKKNEMVRDLEESLNNKNDKSETKIEIPKQNINIQIASIQNNYNEQKEIKNNNLVNKGIEDVKKNNNEVRLSTPISILENYQDISTSKKEQSSSEKYLEEVSRKLAEAEVPDEVERTNYELKQEEDAIISYKELMEKKDNIQTIDEEEAVISIEELMNRANKTPQEETPIETKLYNLSEEEANDNFLKELKQFRNDL